MDDRWTTWQAEQAGPTSSPGSGRRSCCSASWPPFALALVAGPTATADSGDRRQAPTFCAEHRGDPAWDAICAETARRHRR